MANMDNGSGMTSQRTRARMIERLCEQGIQDTRVLTAMSAVPRHLFVSEALAHRAYDDTALPLIHGQTISQPYVVARMIALLLDGRSSLGKTLEIGTGCGYQAAVLAQLSNEVFGVERINALFIQARQNLRQAKCIKVRLKHADGMRGLPEASPFDSIIVAAAAVGGVPQDLLDQLALEGRLIIPLGGGVQSLRLLERKNGRFEEKQLDAVKFVPLLPGAI